MVRISSILALLSTVVFLVAPAQGSKSSAKACGADEFAYAGFQADSTAHGVRTTIAPLSVPTVDDGHVAGWIGVGGVDAGPGGKAEWLQTGLASFSPYNTIYLYYEVTIAGKSRSTTSSRPTSSRARSTISRCSRCAAATRGGASGSTASRSARRSTSRGATTTGTRRRSPRTGTAARAPATRTRTASPNVRLAHANGGAWQTLKERLDLRGSRLPGRADLARSRRNFVATSLVAPIDRRRRLRDRQRRADRHQPGELQDRRVRHADAAVRDAARAGSPARSCRGRRRSRRPASR